MHESAEIAPSRLQSATVSLFVVVKQLLSHVLQDESTIFKLEKSVNSQYVNAAPFSDGAWLAGMLKYAGKYCVYGKYCDAWQSAVTVIRSRNVTLKYCLERLTRSYYNR